MPSVTRSMVLRLCLVLGSMVTLVAIGASIGTSRQADGPATTQAPGPADPTADSKADPASAPQAESQQAATDRRGVAQGLWLVMWLLLLWVAVMTLLALWMNARARRRERERAARALLPSGAGPDPWEEAGRRAKSPTAEEVRAAFGTTTSGERTPPPRSTSTPPDLGGSSPPTNPQSPPQSGGATPKGPPVPATFAALTAGQVPGSRPVAMVTGGAKRVGRSIALALARSGCDVIVTYQSSHEEAGWVAREIEALGRQAWLHRVDFADPAAVTELGESLAATLPRLDVLVHNASAYNPLPIKHMTAEEGLRQYRINALAPLLLSGKLAKLLGASTLAGGGAIVAMVDIHAMGRPRKAMTAYAMSKAALVEMVHGLARELGPKVRVNGVAPGVVVWPTDGPDADPEFQRKYLARTSLGRSGTPEEAAEVVRWLALEATYVTGEIIRVDGGRWLG